MKEVYKVIAIFFAVIVLTQILDFSFLLMNQSDTLAFNMGIVVFLSTAGAFVYLVLYLIKEIKKEIEQNKKEKLN